MHHSLTHCHLLMMPYGITDSCCHCFREHCLTAPSHYRQAYCHSDLYKQISVKFTSRRTSCHVWKCIWKYRLWIIGNFFHAVLCYVWSYRGNFVFHCLIRQLKQQCKELFCSINGALAFGNPKGIFAMSFLFHRKWREPIFGWSFFQSLVTNSSEHEEYSILSDGRHFGKKFTSNSIHHLPWQ